MKHRPTEYRPAELRLRVETDHTAPWRRLCSAVVELAVRETDIRFLRSELCRAYCGIAGVSHARAVELAESLAVAKPPEKKNALAWSEFLAAGRSVKWID